MLSLEQPKTIKLCQLLKMTGMSISTVGTSSPGLSLGFYPTLQEAEHNRTLEILKDQTATQPKPTLHIFELEFPNPAIKNDDSLR